MEQQWNRNDVYNLINGERAHQDARVPIDQWNHGGRPSIEAELLMLQEYMNKARTAWVTSSDDTHCLHTVRKMAAMCVRVLENHGGPQHSRAMEVADAAAAAGAAAGAAIGH